MSTEQYLRDIMARYTTDNLVGITPEDFYEELMNMMQNPVVDYDEEEKGVQRDYSKVFTFGHDHNFGTFELKGAMGERHIKVIQYFIDYFGLPDELNLKAVLDVGVWCGGTSLLLAGMGAYTVGLEEVEMYAACANFLANRFIYSRNNVHVYSFGLYEFSHVDVFDFVIFPGVLYHLSDPVLGLRILFNALKDGGEIFIETACLYTGDEYEDYPLIEYYGSQRPGWNWFAPNPTAMKMMLLDVGFEPCEKVIIENGRLFTKAKRVEWKPMVKAGLSARVR